MELRVLNYFLVVAQEENITKAAKLLHISQPTLSRQMMQLENELGVKLFTRSNHNIILTDEGLLLKRRAQELVSLAEKTKQDIAREDQINGEISIGSGELLSFTCVAEILTSFRDKNPLVSFDIFSGNADSIKNGIEEGLLDVGLLVEPVDVGKYEFVRVPCAEEWGVFVRKDSELAQKGAVSPQDLVGQKLMIQKRALVQDALSHWFGDSFAGLDIIGTYNLQYNVAVMVQQNMGVALGIKLSCEYDELCFVPLSPRLEVRSVLAWKKNEALSPTTKAFINHAKMSLGQ